MSLIKALLSDEPCHNCGSPTTTDGRCINEYCQTNRKTTLSALKKRKRHSMRVATHIHRTREESKYNL